MSANGFDVIVVGVGAMGSATVAELAARGVRVLGIDRASIPNDHGSSGGITRIIRLAYNEDPRYVPMVRHAYRRWHALEDRVGERLLITTGGLDAGPEGSVLVHGALQSCREHGVPHELLSAADVRDRFPGFGLPDDMVAVYQADAGFLLPERAIAGYAATAIEDGAELHGHEPVVDWEPFAGGVIVRTAVAEYRARKLVITAGAWASWLVAPLRDLAAPERQVVIWTQAVRPELFRVGAFPIFILDTPAGVYYGFPTYGIPGVKFGLYHHRREIVDPDAFDREAFETEDEAVIREGIARYFPDANGPTLTLKSCIFTNTPDEHFVIDRYPGIPQVVIASPCSGHGFKFASAFGEVLADLAMDREPAFDLSMFRLEKFAAA